MRTYRPTLCQLYVEKPESYRTDNLRNVFPLRDPVFVPGDHGLPELPLTKYAEGLKGESEAGYRPTPDVSYRQLAGSVSRVSFFGSSTFILGADWRA